MSNSTYLYLLTSFVAVLSLLYLFFNFKPNKTHINNKILLKNLLESLDLELPEELKRIDSSSTDPQWLHIDFLDYLYMSKFNFDDTETSGIWWSTNVSIRDICVELKEDTSCNDNEIVELLRSIANSIEVNGL